MNRYELEKRAEKLLKRVGSTGEVYFDEKVLSKEVVENVPENYMLSYYSDLGDCCRKEKAFKIFVDMSFTTKNGETV